MKQHDDYNWSTYTEKSYESQVFDEIQARDGVELLITEYSRDENNHIQFTNNLHPNWKELYHLVDALNVNSVYEVGCGSGQHLINLHFINPNLRLAGGDYAQSQIDVGVRRLGLDRYDFAKDLQVIDMTEPINDFVQQYELVYTQAVVMHLSYARAKKMLMNMCKMSSKYILMIENTQQHNFPMLIEEAALEFEIINIVEDRKNIVINKKYITNTILLQRRVGENLH
jgi:trans-aconitate methyltransferase